MYRTSATSNKTPPNARRIEKYQPNFVDFETRDNLTMLEMNERDDRVKQGRRLRLLGVASCKPLGKIEV